ncbi:glycoside hydrolase family 2 TIM barrel-domain containing protein [Psychrosphaera sp. 1_MG-2023]|uniref:sugar-binding domain-containing protein n=1 Tax=Psychrosphaera sp. 1_MG-2023 TaxID=3062643 RepID=UPI0026E1485B|nr:sugar-binding domain-containing protein [Psychrosphaera sp. 1_MG-2023]MDO6720741.1 glycoside hydrolase family 2 TIM barrel-domain containing protein [Psychrosphaera sp. 1_MG-2023]
MRTIHFIGILLFGIILQACTNTEFTHIPLPEKRALNFNNDWQFTLGDNQDFATVEFDDDKWRTLTLPHDWSIEAEFDQKYHGATAYLPGGTGWYRKTFKADPQWLDNSTYIYFDGVYANSEVYLNGKYIGGRLNGYSPFYIDISKHLNADKNVLAVKVEHERYIDSRWYTGSGIYRDVTLVSTSKLHIPIWGTYVTTPKVTRSSAEVASQIEIKNNFDVAQSFTLVNRIYDQNHALVSQHSLNGQLAANTQTTLSSTSEVSQPQLWDLHSPSLYTLVSELRLNGKTVDTYKTPFGIRTIEYDANKGFFLNGKNHKIKGVNLHHGAGLVGTAVPNDVWRRRLETLKEAGVNAVRTAHNPVSVSFLELCDELGLLVQAEIFDEWDNPKDKRLNQWERHDDDISRGYADIFQQEAEHDLKDPIKRDRNHPSIIMWSIGNEIEWTYPRYKKATGYFDMNAAGNYFFNPPFISPEEIKERFHSSEEGQYVLAKTAQKLSKWVKEMDTTRPVTANLILPSVSHISGYTDALDVVGYSYRRVIYDYGHELFPDKMILGTENVVQWHEWKAIEERDFIPGTFLWTGIDYLGESNNGWPRKALESGMLDTAGFKTPSFHMYKTLWNNQPHIHITSQIEDKSLYKVDGQQVVEKKEGKWAERVWLWQDVNRHWNYKEGGSVIVEVLSNCDRVELFQNESSLGIQSLSESPDHELKWAVNFTAGQLVAKGLDGCDASDKVTTAKNASQFAISIDKSTLDVNPHHVAHIEIQLTDENNIAVHHQEIQLQFDVSTNVQLLGLDSGNSRTIDKYQNTKVITSEGRALGIVRVNDNKPAWITISGQGLTSKTVWLNNG